MDCFALGGIITRKSSIATIRDAYDALRQRWGVATPLHSSEIRGRRKHFAWLGEDEVKCEQFLADLEKTLLAMPVLGTACVIHRPGYEARYRDRYQEDTWLMCKTAYAIVVERAAKYARLQGLKLEVFF
jgi:sugar phosphate isomerase/epimerase